MERAGDILIRRDRQPPTTPDHECWLCLDTGKQGESFCSCALGARRQKAERVRGSGVPRARLGETLGAFQPLAGTEDALAAAWEVVRGQLCWLLLYGGSGNGKTHLGHGIVLASIEAGREARIAHSLVLLSDIRAVSGTPLQSVRLREMGGVPLLVLDDLVWATDLEARWLEEIMQRRYMHKLPLVATTNRDLKGLPAPVVSRFQELGRVVLNRGKDYRRGGDR